MEIAINAGLTVLGIVMLCYGGHFLVEGGVRIARKFRISSLIIGMTVVAYGTSTPELAASIAAAGSVARALQWPRSSHGGVRERRRSVAETW